jgi:polyhydroxybutyrate depolymerase
MGCDVPDIGMPRNGSRASLASALAGSCLRSDLVTKSKGFSCKRRACVQVMLVRLGLLRLTACALLPGGCKTEPSPQPPPLATGGASAIAGATPTRPAAGATGGTSGQPASVPPPANAGDAGSLVPSAPPADAATAATPDARTDAAPVTPPQTCAPPSLRAGDGAHMLEHGGRTRRYTVHVPSSLDPNVPVALVLDFHGNGSSASQEAAGSGWAQKADAESFITAYPEGVGRGWNVGNCCGEALAGNVDDVGFARAIVAAIASAACVDPKRVYATGISNGAGLAHRLACEAADVFAAIAAASADLVTDPCTPARPIAELSVRGVRDTLVAYEGGNTGSTGWYSPGAKMTLELWKGIDQCTGAAETTREYCETYARCADGVEVTLCSLPNTGHILYDNALGFDVPEVAWEMFVRQPMR